MKDVREAVKLVLSCCSLHEICLINCDEFEEYIQEGLSENEEINDFQEHLLQNKNASQW